MADNSFETRQFVQGCTEKGDESRDVFYYSHDVTCIVLILWTWDLQKFQSTVEKEEEYLK